MSTTLPAKTTGLDNLSGIRRGAQRKAVAAFDSNMRKEIEAAQKIISKEYLGGTRGMEKFAADVVAPIGDMLKLAIEELKVFCERGTNAEVPGYQPPEGGKPRPRSPASERAVKDMMIKRIMGLSKQYGELLNFFQREPPPHPFVVEETEIKPRNFMEVHGDVTMNAGKPVDVAKDFEKFAAKEAEADGAD